VLDAYVWRRDLGDEEILERLLVPNLERAGSAVARDEHRTASQHSAEPLKGYKPYLA
jgi:hypothetical protein